MKCSLYDLGISIGDLFFVFCEMSIIGGNVVIGGLGYNLFVDELVLLLLLDFSDLKWFDYIECSGFMFYELIVIESVLKFMWKKLLFFIIFEFLYFVRVYEVCFLFDSILFGLVLNLVFMLLMMWRWVKILVFWIG